MARLNLVADLGAPATVIAADLLTEKFQPNANEWVAYALTAVGYIGGVMGMGGDYVKNLGVASLPLTARHIANRVPGFMTRSVRGSSASVVRTVRRYPGPTQPAEFSSARLD